MTQTIAITGESAGIDRSVTRLFGARGDRVDLLSRGQPGLDGAVSDVERAGGTPLAVLPDVADFAQLTSSVRIELGAATVIAGRLGARR